MRPMEEIYAAETAARVKKITKYVVIGVILIIILSVLFSSFGTVATGQVGVKRTLDKVSGLVPPGLYIKIPYFQDVVKMDVQVQKEQTTASAASKDLQTVSAQIAVNYQIDQDKVLDLFSRIGENYKVKVIDPAIQEVVKAATAQYTAEELITKRPEVTEKIQTALVEKLAASDILVSPTGVSITDFDFSVSFNDAIEKKVTAEQNALAAKNKLEQVKYESEQVVVAAEAEGKAIALKSQAASNEKYVSLKRLEVQEKAIEKWNGVGCTSYCGLEASTGLLISGR